MPEVILISVVKTDEVEVNVADAGRYLFLNGDMTSDELHDATPAVIAESYAGYAEGKDFELDFNRMIHALCTLPVHQFAAA